MSYFKQKFVSSSPPHPSRTSSIRRDLTLSLVLTIIAVYIFIGAIFYFLIVSQAEENMQTQTDGTIQRLTDVLAFPLWSVDDRVVEITASAYLDSASIAGIQVMDDKGRVVYDVFLHAEALQAPETTPIYFNDVLVGRLDVSVTRQAIVQQQQRFLFTTLVILVFVIGAVIVVTQTFLNRFLSRPLQDLSKSIDRIASGDYSHMVEPVRQSEVAFIGHRVNSMAGQMTNLIYDLEHHISEQTRDLQIAAAVTRQITTILDLEILLPKLAQTTGESFDLYAVYFILYDAKTDILHQTVSVLRDGTIYRDAYSIDINARPSLAAKAARERQPQVINDVNRSADYLHQPTHPSVKAEALLPIIVGNRFIGLLGLQSDEIDYFTESNRDIFTLLAEQIGIAIQNARLYAAQVDLAEDLKAVDQMKSQFLASMSHELRTPLNAILNFTEMTAYGVFGEVNEKQKEALTQAVDSSLHLLSLINDLLDITKIQSGKMVLFIEENVDIREEINTVISTIEGLLQEKPKVVFITHIEDELPCICVDRRRLRQIFLNILSNAVKFTEDGQIEFRIRREGESILFTIRDTGLGIDADSQHDVFEPFVQTTSGIQHGSGTGLGMPISKNLVETHGGDIWFESEATQGSIFYVRLPINGGIVQKERV